VAFAPLPEGFEHVPYDDLDALDAACDPARVAAVIVEPIQGEAGVVVPSSDYLRGVRRICTERGILLMVDEVQTGIARTGRWFAFQYTGVEPDVVTMAKALGNGVPIGACWARAEVAAAFAPGDHASTFGGQPLAAAAARATLGVMEAEDAPGRAARAGARLRGGLEAIDGVSGVRGEGLLLGVALASGRVAEERATEGSGLAMDVVAAALRRGLVVNAPRPHTIRVAPPLLVSDDEIDEALVIFADSVGDVRSRERPDA
jgi:acetylornithine/succinyldiaminopimelate/putrescine aminotransferase